LGPLVPVADPIALAEAMSEVLDNPPDPQDLRRRARSFSLEEVARQYLDILVASD
jgi:glycosyltransferase involved in cell wall biosynthesis